VAASDVAIANLALTKLGDLRIVDLTENTKPAREINAVYAMLRDKLQRRYIWRYAVKRTSLPALADMPDWGYSKQYQLPSDCLRLLTVGEWFAPPDTSDLIGAGGQPYQLEGRRILSNETGPLKIRYLARITDPGQFDACFDEAFASLIAFTVAEALSQSAGKKESALRDYNMALRDAVTSSAIENPPESLADNAWITARL
jgi:hypothetical protein